jgi:hypothetical protein
MSYPYYDQVTRAHAELLAEGKIMARTNQDQTEQDKGLVTRRAAFYANQRDPSHGLLAKTSGNNSLGYSVDWILRNIDGEGWDIVTDAGGLAQPVDGGPVGADPARIADWRQPTAELAQIGGTTPAPEPPPTDQATADLILEVLETLQATQTADTATILARDDANTQRILDTIDSIKTQVEESLRKVLLAYLARRRRDDEPVA